MLLGRFGISGEIADNSYMTSINRYASTVVASPDLNASMDQAAQEIANQLNESVDVLFAFFSEYEAEKFDEVTPRLQKSLQATHVLGCTCESVIAQGKEFESQPAVALWAASLPNEILDSLHLEYQRSPDGGVLVGWPNNFEAGWSDLCSMIALGDPFSFPMDIMLQRFNEDRPGVNIVGGMCSGAQVPGQSRLLLNDQTFSSGAVFLRLGGDAMRQPVVSQGCRPIGETFVVTAAEQNIVRQLGGKPALEQLMKIFNALPTREQRLVQNGLHIGRVINEYQDEFKFGDFLIRNVIGMDEKTGSISIGDFVKPGQTIQFHIRDHESADFEMRHLLHAAKDDELSGALIFSCNGRGQRMFPEPHHDASVVQSLFGPIANAGFFAAGEIGPVGGKNFLHGFTACVALFQ